MPKHTQSPNAHKRDAFLFVPNIVGYLRVLLLCVCIVLNRKWFCILYTISYILDALDGHLARMLGQESQLGYIFDMSLDRASSTILSMYIAKTCPKLFIFMAVTVILDIFSHFFFVFYSLLLHKSHKSVHGNDSHCFISRVLSVYYNRLILFCICFGTEAFMLSLLCPKPIYIFRGLLFPFFLFKQITNVVQIVQAFASLRFM